VKIAALPRIRSSSIVERIERASKREPREEQRLVAIRPNPNGDEKVRGI